MMTERTRPTLWTRWKRGVSLATQVYGLAVLMNVVFYVFATMDEAASESLSQPWRTMLGVVLALGLIAVLFILLPIVLSRVSLNAEYIREEFATDVEQQIDILAQAQDVRWEDYPVSQIDQLIASGKIIEARRLHHAVSQATWDDVDEAIANWRTTVLKEKLKILERASVGDTGSVA